MSNVITKSHKDHQGWQTEHLWTLMSFKADCLSQNISAHLWFDSWLRHNAFRKPRLQTFRLPYHFIVASQWDGNPASTVHAECYVAYAFRTATKPTQRCYQGCAEGDEQGDAPRHPRQCVIQRLKLQKVHLSQSCNKTRGANFLWMLVARRHGRPQKFFQGGGDNVDILVIFQVENDAMQMNLAKRFALSTPQR